MTILWEGMYQLVAKHVCLNPGLTGSSRCTKSRIQNGLRSDPARYGPRAPVGRRFPSTMTHRARIPATYLHSPFTHLTKPSTFERLQRNFNPLPFPPPSPAPAVSELPRFSFRASWLPKDCVWAACPWAYDWSFAMTWCQERHHKKNFLPSSREYTVPNLRNMHQT